MEDQYFIVNKKILPGFYQSVIDARSLLTAGSVKNVSDAVKQVGISCSTYYKFKDYIFLPSEHSIGKKAVISLLLSHELGILSEVLNTVALSQASVLTINQSIPINGQASVMISLDMSEANTSVEHIIGTMLSLRGVSTVRLIALD